MMGQVDLYHLNYCLEEGNLPTDISPPPLIPLDGLISQIEFLLLCYY